MNLFHFSKKKSIETTGGGPVGQSPSRMSCTQDQGPAAYLILRCGAPGHEVTPLDGASLRSLEWSQQHVQYFWTRVTKSQKPYLWTVQKYWGTGSPHVPLQGDLFTIAHTRMSFVSPVSTPPTHPPHKENKIRAKKLLFLQ